MEILIVSQCFYPDDFRVNDIARQMVADGHTVHVLTGLPDYATSRVPKEYRYFRRRRETVDGIDIIRVPIIARRHGVIWRMLNYLSFVISGCLYARFCGVHADIVFSYETSPVLQVLPAITFKKRRRIPLVIYCCDIWPECLKVWGVSEESALFRYIKRLSRRIFNAADCVPVTSPPFCRYVHEVNEVPKEMIVELPQHAEDLFADVAGVYEDNGCTDFMFAGNIGSAQNVGCLVRAAAVLKGQTNTPFHVHVVGDGSAREYCEALAEELSVRDCVTFHGKFPLQELTRFYRFADCFVLTMSDSTVGNSTLPAKWQGYISVGKPLVVSANGACADITELADCGICAPADDADALAAAMREVMAQPELYRQKGANGRRYYEENCTKPIFMERLYHIFETCVNRKTDQK